MNRRLEKESDVHYKLFLNDRHIATLVNKSALPEEFLEAVEKLVSDDDEFADYYKRWSNYIEHVMGHGLELDKIPPMITEFEDDDEV